MVSIIVPVYNTGKYLKRCVDSLITQSEKDIEVILVDDGSKDDSPSICDDYLKRDGRIKVIHKNNGGLATARNAGLDTARGEYIVFVDSDDWVDIEYVRTMKNALVSGNSQLASCGHLIEFVEENETQVVENPITGVRPIKEAITLLEGIGTFNMVWDKMYIRDIIFADSPLYFETNSEPGEDLVFNCEYYKRVNSVSLVKGSLYHYMRQGEISEANRYRKDLVRKNMYCISCKKKLYENLCLTSAEDASNLARCYAAYVFACIPNMYRDRNEFDKKSRMHFYREILSDTEIKVQMAKYCPDTRLMRQFKYLYVFGNAQLLDIIYSILCWFRNHSGKMYLSIRKKLR